MSSNGKRIIKKQRDNTISKQENKVKGIDYPVFCFKYLTTNKEHNIKHFNNARDKQRAYGALFYCIDYMQKISWQELFQRYKKLGFETIKASELNFLPNGYYFSRDEKVIVIRFCKNNYRMIGIQSGIDKNVFHVLGFDFNYSAYKH